MTELRSVHPCVSREALPLTAKDRPTVCVLCSHNCGLRVDVEGGRITEVRPDESNPITHGYVCNKAFRIPSYVEHAQRLEHPLRRRPDGEFEEVSWDVAISEIAERLGAIHGEHGPRSVGLVGIGGQANHMDAPFGLSFLGGLGSRRWFNALAQEKTQHFLIDHWMFDASPACWFHPDLSQASYLLVMGTNPRISNRGHNPNETFRAIVEDPTRSLVVVDPRETETTRGADRHLKVRPGTDVYLLLGMAASLVSAEGGVDATFVAENSVGFEQIREALSGIDIDEMAERCGLSATDIVGTARDFASADSAAVMWDLALEQTYFSTLDSYLVRLLSALTGNVGREGGNVFIETATPPTLSPRRFDEPERALKSGIQGIAAMGGYPMFSPSLVPEEVLLDHPERLRALIVEGSNPLLSFSDTTAWREACDALDLLVVVEPAMTETARLADYVLPTPVGYEKWEIAGFPRNFPEVQVQLRPPVVPGPPDALPEPEIYARLAYAMGVVPEPPEALFALAEDALTPEGAATWLATAQAEAKGNSAALLFWGYRTLGPHLPAPSIVAIWAQCHENAMGRPDSVLRTLGDEWRDRSPFEVAAELFRRILAHPEGVEIARCRRRENLADHIGFEDGKIRLAPEAMLEEIARAADTPPPHDPEYPFVLAAGLRTRWTANTIQRDPAWRKGRGPHCALHLAPDDAKQIGVEAGASVRIATRRGSLELPAAIDPKLQLGHVWVPNGFGARYPNAQGELEAQGVNLNELMDVAARDPFTGCPYHKVTACRIERV